jgi:perosamine synthetase
MIPVFEPELNEQDAQAVAQAVRNGEVSGSFGTSISEFETRFAAYVGSKYGVAVSSGTTALELAVAVAGVGPGDEVLVSACTNIATALAPFRCGAVPVPVDSERNTWNLDLNLIERLITDRTRAIIPVHLLGHPVDMDALLTLADKHRLLVIEDCAESHGATVRGRMTGTFGQLSCFSFYANKLITTGEGGMVLTDNAAYAERARSLRNLAFQQPRFFHEHAGYNFRMTGMQAALGLSQLTRIDGFIDAKRRVASLYNRYLSDVPGITRPVEHAWAKNVYWMYGITVNADFPLSRDGLIAHLRSNGVDSRTFFCSMSEQPFLQAQPGYRAVTCPVANELWRTGLYLPSSCNLTEQAVRHIANVVRSAGA